MAEWSPEVVVDERLAARLIGAQFPDLGGVPVRRFASGWDNAVFSVGDDLVFRFIHRAVALGGSAREIAVLRHLPAMPLPVPRPHYLGRPTPEFAWPFWGGPRLHGTELATARLADDERAPLATALGRFLRALHAPDVASAVTAGSALDGVVLPVDPLRRGDPSSVVVRARERLARMRAAGTRLPCDAVEDLLRGSEHLGAPTREPVLVHGDLHVRHLLVDADGGAAGVIDWGDTALADPAVDLMIAFAAFRGAARQAFLDAYGGLDDETALRARVLAVHVCAALLESADAHDDALVAEVTTAVDRVLAD
ncbi:phosphotransferase [Cellulomonas carbonis]|uniref:Aminoglycoside phosphotransferase n=1 Tax=Cellulomonas carbonis T26 TaxID=947969 RepID=A0A0A0BWP9_9CELL|nr:phosphotransferase [Cellulomonas carbonis]KGM12341.1 aminoglycoside phosphotransferase [Cellulomonas carbonis T26]GGC03482.1 aminoglycoside phosphotransferase [Cellulomonas carbonis]